ncbi:type II toxin-antitoxin system YhaV family toxin [Acidithiobacillus ferrivorans]
MISSPAFSKLTVLRNLNYRQGNTMGQDYRHWRRAKIGRRFRLFFRYDSRTQIIVYAWVNDGQTMRSAGSKSDPYAVLMPSAPRNLITQTPRLAVSAWRRYGQGSPPSQATGCRAHGFSRRQSR